MSSEEIDYSQYSAEELADVLRNIDREAWPARAAAAEAELDRISSESKRTRDDAHSITRPKDPPQSGKEQWRFVSILCGASAILLLVTGRTILYFPGPPIDISDPVLRWMFSGVLAVVGIVAYWEFANDD